MKRNLCSLLLLTGALTLTGTLSANAQDNNGKHNIIQEEAYTGPLNIELSTRVDYQREYLEKDAVKDNCGFKGKYLMLSINGNINDKFSYTYRQRLNELHQKNSFFDGIDKMFITYQFAPKWEITAGKMGMFFGSWEYDRNPQYMYHYSEWTNHLACYKFGAYLTYNPTQNDHIFAQFTESPFNNMNNNNDMYAYHLAWYGNHGWFNTIYSANVLEYNPGKFIYYLCFGHRLEFGKVAMEIDYMNRATGKDTYFFKDCSLIGELQVMPNEHWNIFAKGSYSVNKTNNAADLCMLPGTEITQVSGGVEFFPLKNGNKDIRLHAMYGYNFGTNTNPNGVMKDNQHMMSVGVQWNMDLVDLVKNIWNRSKK